MLSIVHVFCLGSVYNTRRKTFPSEFPSEFSFAPPSIFNIYIYMDITILTIRYVRAQNSHKTSCKTLHLNHPVTAYPSCPHPLQAQ